MRLDISTDGLADFLESKPLKKAYEQHAIAIAVTMANLHLDHIKRLYIKFEGDLLLPIIIAEIGHYGLRNIDLHAPDTPTDKETMHKIVRGQSPCNAYSISQSLGLPHETVRRKITKLLEMGFIERIGTRGLVIAEKTVDYFIPDFDYESLCRLMHACKLINHHLRDGVE